MPSEAAGRSAAATLDTSPNAKFITFETLKAANAFYVAHHAASIKAGVDISGPMVRWFVPFAMMLDMFGFNVGTTAVKRLTVAQFEKLFFEGILPLAEFLQVGSHL